MAAIAMAVFCGFFFSSHERPVIEDSPALHVSTFPPIPRGFLQPLSLEEALNSPPFRLAAIERPIRLPDLRSLIMFYGSNDRPDRSSHNRRLQFGMRGNPTVSTALVGEKVYFKYDTRSNKWSLSDAPTPLTAVFSSPDPAVQVKVEFQDDKGVVINVPSEFHSFPLAPSPAPAAAAQAHQWLCGSLPVDNTLLDRQGAVWWGQDEVVLAFGGKEMGYEASRQRVQVGAGENAYVLWVKEDDCFVYDDDRWNPVELGGKTVGKPLLQAQSIDAHAIHFQLWNPDGTVRHSLDLLYREAKCDIKVPEIKMIGARSKKQWIAEIQGKRLTLTPDDWVLLKSDGFVQLDDSQLLDDYLQGRLTGNLLAFSGIEKVDGELCLMGTFYDSTRTLQAPFAISLYRSWSKHEPSVESISSDDDDEDLFEDEDEDDEDIDDDEIEKV